MKQLLTHNYFSGNNISLPSKIFPEKYYKTTHFILHFRKSQPLENKHLSVIEPSNIFHILPNHHFPGNTQ